MKPKLSLTVLALLLAAPLYGQVPVAMPTVAAAWGSGATASVSIAAVAGIALSVECNLPSNYTVVSVTDNQGDGFVPVSSQVAQSVSQSQIVYIATRIKGGTTKVTCTANAAPGQGEIYVTPISGADPNNPVCVSASFDGISGNAKGSVTTISANCLLLAYAVSGEVGNASGWTALSTFDSNLETSQAVAVTGTTVTASFSASSDWSMILVAYQPVAPVQQPFVWVMTGGPTFTFPMTIPPACTSADGPSCSITIQVTDQNGNILLTGSYGTISLVKTGAQGVLVTPVVTAAAPSQ